LVKCATILAEGWIGDRVVAYRTAVAPTRQRAWRQKPNHPLPWFLVAGRYVRYRAGDVKIYVTGVLRQKRARSHRARSERERRTADQDPTTP
jgi:hypothetical protein